MKTPGLRQPLGSPALGRAVHIPLAHLKRNIPIDWHFKPPEFTGKMMSCFSLNINQSSRAVSEGRSGCGAQIHGWILRSNRSLVIPVLGKGRVPPAVDGGGCLQGEAARGTESRREPRNTAQKATLQPQNPADRVKGQNPICWKRCPCSSGEPQKASSPHWGRGGRSIPLRPVQDTASSLGVLPRSGAAGKA